MGSCNCQTDCIRKMDLYENNEDKNKGQIGENYQVQNDNDISKFVINTKKKEIENNLLKFGIFIPINDFNRLIPAETLIYIENNKLDYKNYINDNIEVYLQNPFQFPNSNIYYGNWSNNIEMEGYGRYYLKESKIITEGVWNKGNIIFGRIFCQNGDIYEGEMKNSKPNGEGKFLFANNEKYVGEFKDGEINGFGDFIFEDKTEYKGQFANGLFNGKGKMVWKNGIVYEGNFLDSTLNGEGIITSTTKSENYKGNFDKNEFNGKGIYHFSNGEEYEGYFEYGIKKGNGKYKRSDGIIFEGIWDDDLPNGNGQLIYNENKLYGFWRNGIFVDKSEKGKEEVNKIFENIDKNIKPPENNRIYPSSLSHLSSADTNSSQFIANKEFNFA